MRNALIIGGSSGLGHELARLIWSDYTRVWITGRKNPEVVGLKFLQLDMSGLSSEDLSLEIDRIVSEVGRVDLLVHAAGYYQQGRIDDLREQDMMDMLHVGLASAMFAVSMVLARQEELGGFLAVTSTSQWVPRELEPAYTAAKAGLAAFANSLSLDPRVTHTLVAAPSGMRTKFWEGTRKDTNDMMDPAWVAARIWEQFPVSPDFEGPAYKYRQVRILRNVLGPGQHQIEVFETR
jgi:NAD(P)-dependent dehydrogenase (short-subunit alcohol dehydrogenase family)